MARVVNSSSAEKYATKAWWAACRRIWYAKYPMNCRYKLIMCCVCDMLCSCMHVLYFFVSIALLQTLIACHTKQQTCKDHEETIPLQVTISHSFSSCLLCPSLGLFNFRCVFLLAKFIALNAKRAWQVEAWRGQSCLCCLRSVYQLRWCVWTRGCGRECGTDHASCQQYKPAARLPFPSLSSCCQPKWKNNGKNRAYAMLCNATATATATAAAATQNVLVLHLELFLRIYFLFSPAKQQHALYIICTFHLVPKNTKKSTAAATGATRSIMVRMCVGVRVNECVPLPVCECVCVSAYSVNTRINKPPIAGTHLGAGLLNTPLHCHVDVASMPGASKTESESALWRMPNKMKCSAKK